MSHQPANFERLLREGAARVLSRAGESYSLDAAALLPRVRATLEKYLLRDQPEASPAEMDQFIDSLRADDLCLVVACERGDEAAWRDLMERFGATVLSSARSVSAGESEAEELAQSVWAELYGLRARAGGGAGGKLAYYSGCGSLGGWLRAVVSQLGVDRHRRTSRLVQTEEASDFDRLAESSHVGQDGYRVTVARDPESTLAETEITGAVHDTLAQAIAELAAEDRLLIKLYYFDGLRLREAGAVLGVHEATASRRLSRLHTDLRRRVESLLVTARGWTRQEAERSLSTVAAHLDADLSRLLAGEGEQASGERAR